MSSAAPLLRVVQAAPLRRETPDAVLVARASAGEQAAVEAIFRRHAALVLHLATRLLRDRVEAEDVMQETFEIALGRVGDLRDPAALRPWLVKIAVRQVRQRFRRRRLLRALGFVWGGTPEVEASLEACASEGASPEHRAELALLDHCLGQLPDGDRLAWMLRHVEGLQLDECALALGCSLATAKRRIHAADVHVRARVTLAPLQENETHGA